LPNLGTSTPEEYIKRLAGIVFTRQAAEAFEVNFNNETVPDLCDFIIHPDTGSYCRVNDSHAEIPNFALRIAVIWEDVLTSRNSNLKFINQPHYFSSLLMVFIRAKLEHVTEIMKIQRYSFIISCQLLCESDEETYNEKLKLMNLSIESLVSILDPLIPQGPGGFLEDDILTILSHYQARPDDFKCNSQITEFGFFNNNKCDNLNFCKALFIDLFDRLEGMTVVSHPKHNLLDIRSNTNKENIRRLIAFSKILNINGADSKLELDTNGEYVIRLPITHKVVKAIEETFITFKSEREIINQTS
jgi:hypothetical protein